MTLYTCDSNFSVFSCNISIHLCQFTVLSYLCQCAVQFLVNVSGVYTRNRNFRLLLSTKLGKSSGELKVARENQFQSPRSSSLLTGDSSLVKRHRVDDSLQQTFLDSLICNVQYVCTVHCALLLL